MADRIAAFVDQMKAITAATDDERRILQQVRPLVKELCENPDWVRPDFYEIDEEQGIGIKVLHEGPAHELAVFAICWRPGRVGLPHDHGTWAVVGGVDGQERNVHWRRAGDETDEICRVEKESEVVCGRGDVVTFLPRDIHSVNSEGESVTLSLHVYGTHTNHTDRYRFDPTTGRKERHILKTTAA